MVAYSFENSTEQDKLSKELVCSRLDGAFKEFLYKTVCVRIGPF